MPYLYKIKFLSEPLIGRELALKEGPLILGNTENSDVLFNQLSNLAEIKIIITPDSIHFASPTDAWIEHRYHPALTQIPLGLPVKVSGISFVIAETETDISALTRWPEYVKQKKPVRGVVFIITTAILLSSFFAGGCYLLQPGADKGTGQKAIDSELKSLKGSTASRGLNIQWEGGDAMEISGWCLEEKKLTPLMALAQRNHIALHNKAICQDRLIRNVKYAVQLSGYDDINVEPDKSHGTVIIEGSIQDDKRWQQTEALLSTMPGLNNWRVVDENTGYVAELIKKLKEKSLSGLVSIRKMNKRIIISGKLNDSQVSTLSEIIRHFMYQTTDDISVSFQNVNSNRIDDNILPAPLVSIGGNETSPYLELKNGERLQKGAQLPSGWVIRHIDVHNGIELSRRGELIHVPAGF